MTQYIVYRKSELNRNNSNYRLEGIRFTASAGQTTAYDWELPEERWITGGQLICKGHVFGDSVNYKVVYKYQGGESVIGKFVSNMFVSDDSQAQVPVDVDYVSLLNQGLYIRIEYTSTGENDVDVVLRLFSHIPKDVVPNS